MVSIDFASKESFEATVKVTDISGKTVKAFGASQVKMGINNLNLNIDGLNAGIYLLVIEGSNGKVCQRFIKN
jgi:hypothetical protein